MYSSLNSLICQITLMATVDAMMSPPDLTVAAKVSASAASSEPAKKKAKKGKDPKAVADRKRAAFCNTIRTARGRT
jgi:hypothetical protein